MARVIVEIEVEETEPDKWSAWDPITGAIETRPTKWQTIQAIVNKRAQNEAATSAVKIHGQGSA